MKFIREKKVRNRNYYYFEVPLRIEGKRHVMRQYWGSEWPEDLGKKVEDSFELVAKEVVKVIGADTKQYFEPKTITPIEKARFWYYGLHHEVFKKNLKNFRVLFSVLFILNSNRAEGSQVTRKDIEKFILRKRKPKTSLEQEVINSLAALDFAFSKEMKWNLKSIKQVHAHLFKDTGSKIAGKFKKVEVVIANETTTPPKEVVKELGKLLKWFKENKRTMYPPQLALEFHYRFEAIHPFEDGNGRVGRILFNAYLIEMGYMPTLFFCGNHRSYSRAISKARDGHSVKFAHYFIDQIKKTRKAVEAYEKEGIIRGGSPQVGQWEIERGKIRKF
jgi:fido (protein-threonine AMPylation protein)